MSSEKERALDSKTSRPLLGLIVSGTVVIGLLTGGNVDRMLIATPAWSHAGLAAWADFTRYADLGNGKVVYPAMAFSGTLFCVGAAILYVRATGSTKAAGLPLILAAALMLVSLPFSFAATPFILSLNRIRDADIVGLEHAFSGASFWGRFQGFLHLAAFGASLWSLAAVAELFSPRR